MEAIYLYLPLILLALPLFTNYYLNKIQNHPPSPFPTIPFLGHLHLLISNPIHATLSKISARYGPILLLKFGSRRVVLVSSPEAVKECFTRNDVVLANRPHLLAGKHFGYGYTNLAWAPHGKLWRQLRSLTCLNILQPCHEQPCIQAVLGEEVRLQMVQLIKKFSPGDHQMKEVKMKKVFVELVLNVMMGMFAGKRYFKDEKITEEEKEEAEMFTNIVRETFKETGETNLVDYFPGLELLGVSGAADARMKALQADRDSFVQGLIDKVKGKKENSQQNEKTIIEALLAKQTKEPGTYDDAVIKSSLLVLLAAGTDTSAGTMEWAMTLLLNNPQVLNKAQKEIESVIGEEYRLLQESDLERLPYLDSIIMETLRMYPAGPMLVPHESSKDQDCTIGDYQIPRGTMLMVNMWAIQNDPNLWEEPRKFMPERFNGKEKDEFKLLPFGYGRRSCPGEGLAKRMVGLALGSLIQCFEWERIGEEMIDLTEGPGLTLLKVKPLEAKCRPRPEMASLISKI